MRILLYKIILFKNKIFKILYTKDTNKLLKYKLNETES